MSNQSYKMLICRALDLLIIGLLIFGSQDAKDFSWWIIMFVVVASFVLAMFMDKKSAEEIKPKTIARWSLRIAICLGYTGGLIYAGFSFMAAAYAIVSIIVLRRAVEVLEDQP